MLSYWAPGNIYAQRGTLSFYWRSRDAVGPTPFPVFRVGYGDHSSWDMVWLRIDYNGKPGFDAFVTDINLARTRVSYAMPAFPKPEEWVHLALAWDENRGIRFYVNGKFVAEAAATGMFNAALDQFGPHSRAISPVQVQSAYNFVRGGDIDEIRIYDRMLSDDNIAALARNQTPRDIPALARNLSSKDWQQEWWFRYGWNRPGDVPPPLAERYTTVRKVEIHDAYDLKRWWWRATDGIRETTWPGVYNRSRLPGRNDYFQLPDWDCYSLSGKAMTFFMPDEPWNHLEIAGGAWGNMTLLRFDLEKRASVEKSLFERPKGQEKTFHRFDEPITGQKIRFTNVEQETPIGELAAYYVHPGKEPDGIAQLRYRLTAGVEPDNPSLKPLTEFIDGRYPPDERVTMVALPAAAPRTPRKTAADRPAAGAHPHPGGFSRGAQQPRFLLRLGEHARRPRRHRHRSSRAARQAHPRRVFPAEHPGERPALAHARYAGLHLLRQARRAAHSLARHARPDSAQRQEPLSDHRRRGRRFHPGAARRRRGAAHFQALERRRPRTRTRPLHAGARQLLQHRRGACQRQAAEQFRALRRRPHRPAARQPRSHPRLVLLVRHQQGTGQAAVHAARSSRRRARCGLSAR